jgi:hypothetical protein
MGREGHPCRREVKGFFGRFPASHGQPGLGDRRRACKCDEHMEFRRDYETGQPFLGCSEFPRCTQTVDNEPIMTTLLLTAVLAYFIRSIPLTAE